MSELTLEQVTAWMKAAKNAPRRTVRRNGVDYYVSYEENLCELARADLLKEIQNQYRCIESHAELTFKAEDERDKLKAQLAEAVARGGQANRETHIWGRVCDVLKTKLEQLEGQEPFGFVLAEDLRRFKEGHTVEISRRREGPEDVAVYAAPKPAPKEQNHGTN